MTYLHKLINMSIMNRDVGFSEFLQRCESVMAAAVYDSVADDSADVCDPTVTFHLWLAPTPAADVQVIAV